MSTCYDCGQNECRCCKPEPPVDGLDWYIGAVVGVTVLCVLGVGGWAVVQLVQWVTTK